MILQSDTVDYHRHVTKTMTSLAGRVNWRCSSAGSRGMSKGGMNHSPLNFSWTLNFFYEPWLGSIVESLPCRRWNRHHDQHSIVWSLSWSSHGGIVIVRRCYQEQRKDGWFGNESDRNKWSLLWKEHISSARVIYNPHPTGGIEAQSWWFVFPLISHSCHPLVCHLLIIPTFAGQLFSTTRWTGKKVNWQTGKQVKRWTGDQVMQADCTWR